MSTSLTCTFLIRLKLMDRIFTRLTRRWFFRLKLEKGSIIIYATQLFCPGFHSGCDEAGHSPPPPPPPRLPLNKNHTTAPVKSLSQFLPPPPPLTNIKYFQMKQCYRIKMFMTFYVQVQIICSDYYMPQGSREKG